MTATRYVTPLREGGSLPGLMEADDLGTYVVKYVGAGQGRKTLVAEVICAALGRALGLRVPDLVLVDVDPALGLSEPDEEVQDLLKASGGLNLGMDYLPGALGFDPLAHPTHEAALVLWFDAYVGNVDRSWRNPNLLVWHRDLWLIDHGATLLFHHSWGRDTGWATKPYDRTGHVLHEQAGTPVSPTLTTEDLRAGRGRRPGPVAHRRAGVRLGGRPPSGVRRAADCAARSTGPVAAVSDPSLYQYALLQAVPRAERGECVNLGVVLYSQELAFLDALSHVDAGPAALPRPAASTSRASPPRWTRSAARSGARVRPARPRSGSASAGSPRRAAPSCAPAPMHTGKTADPAGDLARLHERLVR